MAALATNEMPHNSTRLKPQFGVVSIQTCHGQFDDSAQKAYMESKPAFLSYLGVPAVPAEHAIQISHV